MNINIPKQVNYWKNGAQDDIEAAELLINKEKTLQGLFFAHLALEKSIKALVVKNTCVYPKRTHNLVLLAIGAKIELESEHQEFIADMNRFCLHGRYPEPDWPKPDIVEAARYLTKAKELVSWLINQ